MLPVTILSTHLPFVEAIAILLILICSVVHTSLGEDTLNPPYDMRLANGASGLYTHEPNIRMHEIDLQALGATDSYPLTNDNEERLQIFWVNSTVHEISISWKLLNTTGFIRHSIVEYFPPGGRFTSHPLQDDVRNFTFVNLDPGTVYTICVYMAEVYGADNSTEKSISRCVKINTIDYIRRDSLIILIITLGYYALMGLIGYTQWRRRQCSLTARSKYRSRTSDVNACAENKNTTMRWKDLAERERLMTSKPGCSIECNDT